MKIRLIKKTGYWVAVSAVMVMFSGCAATKLAIAHKNLAIETKASNSVFLDPVEDNQKTVYVQIRNSSDHSEFRIKDAIVANLQDKGYRITHHLSKAHYLVQANILSVGKTNPSAAEKSLTGGYGSSLTTAASAAVATSAFTHASAGGIIAGGLIGGVVSTIADSAVHDTNYTVITDLRISERVRGQINQRKVAKLQTGLHGSMTQTSHSKTHFEKHDVRLVSTANRVNLKFATALPKLEYGLAHAIAGYF